MESKIINFIKEKHPTYQCIIDTFSDADEMDIITTLGRLEKDGKIDKLKDAYYLTSELNMVSATIVSIKERFAFASVSEDEEVYIAINNLKNAFLDDRVLLKRISDPWMDKEEYEVVKVTNRARKTLVGEVKITGGVKTLHIEKIAQPKFLFLIKEKKLTVTRNQIIKVQISKITQQSAVVEPIEIIGNKMDIGVDVTRIILANNAPLEFNDEVKEQVKSIPSEVHDDECINRRDFSDHLIVTIDGEDAKDFDDAVEVIKDGDYYHVGVHIADVSHYVKENTPIDVEALNRATSLYVQDRVVPMLPFELSNGICSLNPHVRRLVTSCLFTVNKHGKIVSSWIGKGVICSKHRLTYSYVNKFLNEDRKLKTEYDELEKLLINLQEVSNIIRKKRQKMGGLELESTELKFELGDDGIPLEVKKRHQDVGENLIEDLMITANEVVASTIEKMKLPMVYRIHGKPKAKKMESFGLISYNKGYSFDVDPLCCRPIDIASYLNGINDPKDKEILSSLLLRCLAKAKYDNKNEKHFGLASPSYTHFTSPIRRYPDLIVHRLIDKYIVNGQTNVSDDFSTKLGHLSSLCSTREKRALVIERSVDALMCAKYMAKHLGEEYDATIVSMISSGLFVEIENGIQGFLSFDTIPGDYFVFDESTYQAYGVRKKQIYSLGDVIHVIVCNVDVEHGQIDFAMLKSKRTSFKKARVRKYGRKY